MGDLHGSGARSSRVSGSLLGGAARSAPITGALLALLALGSCLAPRSTRPEAATCTDLYEAYRACAVMNEMAAPERLGFLGSCEGRLAPADLSRIADADCAGLQAVVIEMTTVEVSSVAEPEALMPGCEAICRHGFDCAQIVDDQREARCIEACVDEPAENRKADLAAVECGEVILAMNQWTYPPSNAIAPTGELLDAIPTQRLESPPIDEPDTWRPSPGYRPNPSSDPETTDSADEVQGSEGDSDLQNGAEYDGALLIATLSALFTNCAYVDDASTQWVVDKTCAADVQAGSCEDVLEYSSSYGRRALTTLASSKLVRKLPKLVRRLVAKTLKKCR